MSNENKALSAEEIAEKYFGGTGTLNNHLVKDAVIAIEEFAEPLTSQITHLEGMVRQANEDIARLHQELDLRCRQIMTQDKWMSDALKESNEQNTSLLKQVGELKEDLARDSIEWLDIGQEYVAKLAAEKQKSERLLEAIKAARKSASWKQVSALITAYEGKNTEG